MAYLNGESSTSHFPPYLVKSCGDRSVVSPFCRLHDVSTPFVLFHSVILWPSSSILTYLYGLGPCPQFKPAIIHKFLSTLSSSESGDARHTRARMDDRQTPQTNDSTRVATWTMRRGDNRAVVTSDSARPQIFRLLSPLSALDPHLHACFKQRFRTCRHPAPQRPTQHPRPVQERGLRARGQQRGLPAGPLPGGEGPPQGPPLRHVAADGIHGPPRRQGPSSGAALQPLLPR